MAIIKVMGEAVVFDFRSPESEDDVPVVEDPKTLKSLHGLEDSEIFSDYIADGGDKTLLNAGVSGGKLRFEFDSAKGRLVGVTEYTAPRLLSEKELELLKDYTIGQWSDGIGEGFFQLRMSEGLAPQLLFTENSQVSIVQHS